MNVAYINRRAQQLRQSLDLVLNYIDSTFYEKKPFSVSEISSFLISARTQIEEIEQHIEEST